MGKISFVSRFCCFIFDFSFHVCLYCASVKEQRNICKNSQNGLWFHKAKCPVTKQSKVAKFVTSNRHYFLTCLIPSNCLVNKSFKLLFDNILWMFFGSFRYTPTALYEKNWHTKLLLDGLAWSLPEHLWFLLHNKFFANSVLLFIAVYCLCKPAVSSHQHVSSALRVGCLCHILWHRLFLSVLSYLHRNRKCFEMSLHSTLCLLNDTEAYMNIRFFDIWYSSLCLLDDGVHVTMFSCVCIKQS